MVAKTPEERYQSMTEVIAELEPWRQDVQKLTVVDEAPTARIPVDQIVMLEPSQRFTQADTSGDTTANRFDTSPQEPPQKPSSAGRVSTGSPFAATPSKKESPTNRVALAFIGLLVASIVLGCVTLGYFFVSTVAGVAYEASNAIDCENNLKQIALALQNYHDTHLRLPPAIVADEEGETDA